MADTPSSDSIPADSVPSGAPDAVADGDTGETQSDGPDKQFTLHRQLTFTLSYHSEGSVKPKLIRQFIKWIRK